MAYCKANTPLLCLEPSPHRYQSCPQQTPTHKTRSFLFSCIVRSLGQHLGFPLQKGPRILEEEKHSNTCTPPDSCHSPTSDSSSSIIKINGPPLEWASLNKGRSTFITPVSHQLSHTNHVCTFSLILQGRLTGWVSCLGSLKAPQENHGLQSQ